ncbi:Intradiol ring-cleavage dioxygenase [Pholiota molesta]|nr:Intradiol ring-cleavage dioxygenase [Pholiota molesta]
MRSSAAFLFLHAILQGISGHPGEHKHLNPNEVLVRRQFLQEARGSIARCRRSALNDSLTNEKAIQRRKEMARTLRARRGLPLDMPWAKRDFETVLATDHASERTGLGAHPPDQEVFPGGVACVLQPEVTVGPYWVRGELVRSDIAEGQAGVPLYMEYQIIDTTSCEPLSGAYVDVWHANATGVYSGVIAHRNGNSHDAANAHRTHNRGIQKTDPDGVVSFQSIFPGHYTGRTHHVHLITTTGASETSRGALIGGHVSHVGQVFFDQDLTDAIEDTPPYTSNTQQRTPNRDDDIMQEESASMDPVFEYVWLGDQAADGVLAWITVGVDPRATYAPRAAATAPAGRV